MLTVVVGAVAVGVLGHLTFELLVPADSDTRVWGGTELLFGKLLLAVLPLTLLALVLVQTGLFSAPALLLSIGFLLVLVAVLLKKTGRKVLEMPSFQVDRTLMIVPALIIAGALLYVPPFEQVVGERDPTTYILTGASMARTGSLTMHDSVIAELSEAERHEFVGGGVYRRQWQYGPRFPGWFLTDLDSGRVLPQGLPLYPTAIAVGYLFGEMRGALQATRIIAIAAVVALFFLCQRLFGTAVGATAAIFLMVSPSQVWYSRYANAESIAQLLLLAGLYALVVFRQQRVAVFGLLAAIAFGLSWQAHIWTSWLVFPLFGLLVLDLARGTLRQRDVIALWAPLGGLGIHALVVYWLFEKQYLASIFMVLNNSRWVWFALLGPILVFLALSWWWGRRRTDGSAAAAIVLDGADSQAADSRIDVWLRGSLATILLVAAVYGYWIRPMVSTEWRAEAVPVLALATTGAVFWLAVAGALLLLLEHRGMPERLLLLWIGLGIAVPILAAPKITPLLMWALRRFQTFLPLVFLLAAAAVWWPLVGVRKRLAGRALTIATTASAIVAVGLGGLLATNGLRYRGFEQPGAALAAIEEIAGSVEDNAVLVFEPRSGSRLLGFAPALAYWKGFDVVWFHQKQVDDEVFRGFVMRQAQRGRPVYYFTQGFNYYLSKPRFEPHRKWVFQLLELEEARRRLPTEVRSNAVQFTSYRVEPGGNNGPLEGELDVGDWDEIYVGEVGAVEISGDRTARWTKGTSFFWLPGLDDDVTEIIVQAASLLGSAQPPRTLTARLDGVDLGEIPIEENWRDYVFEVPSQWQSAEGVAPRLELLTDPVQPDQILGNGDLRYLGVFVDAITWR